MLPRESPSGQGIGTLGQRRVPGPGTLRCGGTEATVEEAAMKRVVVILEQVKETKGTYRFDSPDPDAAVANVYVRKSAFGDAPAPRRITLVIEDAEKSAAQAR